MTIGEGSILTKNHHVDIERSRDGVSRRVSEGVSDRGGARGEVAARVAIGVDVDRARVVGGRRDLPVDWGAARTKRHRHGDIAGEIVNSRRLRIG